MPITKSAKKALRQNKTRHAKNISQKLELKAAIKKFKKLAAAADKKAALEFLSTVFQKLDKSAKTNLLKKNTASRLKSRLSRKLIAVK